MIMKRKCGYFFSDDPVEKKEESEPKETTPRRWGPDDFHPDGRRKFATAGFLVIPFLFRRRPKNSNGDSNGDKH